MWTCPKCRREFQRRNQSHYCGAAPASIEDYIAAQEEYTRQHLQMLTALIRAEVPDFSEYIKWSMPYFQTEAGSVSFAACKNWISFYVGEEMIALFSDELGAWKHKKDALYLPYDKPLPETLLKQIVRKKLL